MITHTKETVGIASIGCHIPAGTITSAEIAEAAGLPMEVLTEKIGMQRKPIAGAEETPSLMAADAARKALVKAGLHPHDLHIIISCGAAPQDFLHWSTAGKLQHMLGATNAFAFDVSNGCNGLNLGMQVAKEMLLGNSAYSHALVVTADKYSAFLNYSRVDDLSLFHLSDAAAAVILKKNETTNRFVSYYQITEGSYSDQVRISAGGSAKPCSGENHCRQTFSVEDPAELSRLLTEVYLKNYIQAIRKALEIGGYQEEDISYLLTNQVKLSTIKAILEAFGLPESRTLRSIADHGHMGGADTAYGLSRLLEEKRIDLGDLVVLASSATGFSWAATVLQF
ncbi:MAG: 3-oxoacyl-[acyl-carrier-protein] synthase III C-terminal domain-containing protein [Syntrophobacteraceae bacterium]